MNLCLFEVVIPKCSNGSICLEIQLQCLIYIKNKKELKTIKKNLVVFCLMTNLSYICNRVGEYCEHTLALCVSICYC